jgi:hypothetical protein
MGPRWGPDTKTDWLTDRKNNLNLNRIVLQGIADYGFEITGSEVELVSSLWLKSCCG